MSQIKNKMRILHIAQIGRKAEGVGNVLNHLVKEQEANGHEVRIISKFENVAYKELTCVYKLDKNINIIQFLKSWKPDIVHFHSVFHISFVFYSWVLRMMKIPYVIQMHGAFSLENYRKNHVKKLITRKLVLNSFLSHAKSVIFLNKNEACKCVIKDSCKRTDILPNGCREIPGLDLSRSPKSVLSCVYVGRIEMYHKGLDLLLDAFELLPKNIQSQFHIDIYGNEVDADVDILRNRLYSVHDCITFHGGLYGDAKDKVLREADMFVLTSRSEGMPMGVLEALSYGLPCIVTPGTNLSEEIADYQCGWVAQPDPKDIARIIEQSLADYKHNFSDLRCNAIKMSQKYSWSKIGEKSVDIYKRYSL